MGIVAISVGKEREHFTNNYQAWTGTGSVLARLVGIERFSDFGQAGSS